MCLLPLDVVDHLTLWPSVRHINCRDWRKMISGIARSIV
jgi:hypothetical protein